MPSPIQRGLPMTAAGEPRRRGAPGGGFELSALLDEAAWVQQLARRLTGDPDRAGDVAQGALALALEKQPPTRDGLRPWLGTVVARLARRQVRASARRHHHERQAAALSSVNSPGADELVLRVEAQRHLAEATCRLPEPYRDVLLRRFYDGQGVEEIARARGQSPSTVRSQITRGMARLRDQFEGQGALRVGKRHGLDGLGLLALAAGRADVLPLGSAAAMAGSVPTGASSAAAKSAAAGAMTVKVAGPALLVFLTLLVAGYQWNGKRRSELDSTSPAIGMDGVALGAKSGPESGAGHDAWRLLGAPVPGPRSSVPSTAPPSLTEAGNPSQASGDGPAIRVHVFGNDLQPIEGVRLRWNESVPVSDLDKGVAITDADGVAVLEVAATSLARYQVRGEHAPFVCEAPGYRRRYLEAFVELTGVTDLGRISMQPGGSVPGRVVWESGEPVAGARVISANKLERNLGQLRRIDGPLHLPNQERRARTQTDAGGLFTCEGLKPGEVRLWAQAEGTLWTLSRPAEVAAGRSVDVGDMVLTPADPSDMITGRVLGEEGRGAVIWVESLKARLRESVRADQNGEFRFLPPQGLPLAVVAQTAGEPRWMGPLVIAQSGDALEFELAPAHSVEVALIDASGAPVEGASIQPYLRSDSMLRSLGGASQPIPGASGARTDAHGRATLSLPAVAFSLRFAAGAAGSGEEGPFAADHAGQILIRLTAAAIGDPEVKGSDSETPLGPDGQTLEEESAAPPGPAHFTGSFFVNGKPAAGWAVSLRRRYSDPGATSAQPAIWTDASGSFRCEVAPGSYDVILAGTLGGGERVTVMRETRVQGSVFPWECELKTHAVSLNLSEPLSKGRALRGHPENGFREFTDLGPVPAGPIEVNLPVGANVLQAFDRTSGWQFVQGVLSKASVGSGLDSTR